jgi:phosphohistidine phosphatase SixA
MRRRSALLLFASPLFAQNSAVTVIFVRHGDRDHGSDPDEALNAQGLARAEELARVLGDSGVTHIFATGMKRTQQTAAPLAAKLKLKTTIIPAAEPAKLIQSLRELPPASVAFVASHGDKLPDLLKEFGHAIKPFFKLEYDRLYFMTMLNSQSVALTQIRFGAHRPL